MPISLKGTGSWCAPLTKQLNVPCTMLIRSTLPKCTAQEAQQGVTAFSEPSASHIQIPVVSLPLRNATYLGNSSRHCLYWYRCCYCCSCCFLRLSLVFPE